MTTLHHIGELLQSGVRPTEQETEHLRSLGGFVAEMFGRYLTGGREVLSSGPDSWSSRLSGRLSAANGERWEQGLGLGEMFLASDLTNFWNVAKGGFAAGYGRLDADRSMLELFEEEVAPQPEVQTESAPRRRRPSLFGAKGQVASGKSVRAASSKAPAQTRAMRAARWADGGTAEMTVVKALASGGLFVGDQVSELIAESGEVFGRGGKGAQRSVAAARGADTEAVGAESALASRQFMPAVALDGLQIDGRTPALASALARAQAVFGRGEQPLKPAVAASRMDSLGAVVPFSMSVDRGFGLGKRPVYGFYDAATTTYVNLSTDEIQAAEAPGAVDVPGVGRPGRAARGLGLPPSASAQRAAVAASAGPRGRIAPSAQRGLSLDSLVRPAVDASGIAPLRPLSAAALSGPDVAVASKVVFTPDGAAMPQVQRGGAFAPRISLTHLAAAAASPGADAQTSWLTGGAHVTGSSAVRFDGADPSASIEAARVAPNAVHYNAAGLNALVGRSAALAQMAARGGVMDTGATVAQAAKLGSGADAAQVWRPEQGPVGLVAERTPMGQVAQLGAPVWRLAADAGPDLPVGAGFTGPEAFAAMAGARGARELGHAGVGFRPTIAAETGATGAARRTGSRLAGMVDGLVWVALPVAGEAAELGRDPLADMGLASLPTGRRAAMVPAHVAAEAISARSSELGMAQAMRQASGRSGLTGDVARRLAVLEGPARDAARALATAERATVGQPLQGGASAELAQAPRWLAPGVQRAALSMGLVAQLSPAIDGGGSGAALAFGAATMGSVGRASTGDAGGVQALGQTEQAARGDQAGAPTGFRTSLSTSAGIGERLARLVEGGVSGGYGRLDADRVMVASLGSEAGPMVGTNEAEAGVAPRTMGRRLAGRIGSAGEQVGAEEMSLASASGAAARVIASARQALRRPVPTAREAREAAAAFSGGGAVRQLLAQQAAGGRPVGSDEPVLGRIVAARSEAAGQLAGASARWESSPELVARIGALESGARRELASSLRRAGWAESELQMLRLDSREGTESGAETAVSRMDAARVSRSLARVVAGAEALGGPVESSVAASGKAVSTVAARMTASPMPMLEGRSAGQDYFGSLASAGSPVTGYRGLQEELVALVKMSEAVSMSAGDPVAAEAQAGLVARARGVLARTSGADRGAAEKLVARLEAVAGRAQATGQVEQARKLGAIAQSMGAAGMEPRALSSLELGSAGAFDAQLERIEGLAEAGAALGGGSARSMNFREVEMSVVALEREVAPGLEERLAQALALSTAGPAGARRLLGGRGAGAQRAEASATRDGVSVESLRAGTERAPRTLDQAIGTSQERRLASLVEELGAGLPVSLNKVIAPEAMLHGLRSPELSAAIKTLKASGLVGSEAARVFATLADSGVDLAAARSSLAAGADKAKLSGVERFAEAASPDTRGVSGFEALTSTSELAERSAERSLLSLVAEGGESSGALARVAEVARRGGLSRSQRAGLLSSLLRGTERAERTSLIEEAGGSDFAYAWLSRVDGSRTGLDLGMAEARFEFGRAFGGRRDSAISMDSPIGGASLVAPVAPNATASAAGVGAVAAGRASVGVVGGRADKSGLRSIAATLKHSKTGAARAQHGASQAVRRTDWSFVDTGSRASTTHADLGKLASAIVGSSEAGQRAPMPLVAPAVKAVAQTALRDPTTSSERKAPAASAGGASGDVVNRGPVDAKMSEKAIEMLAVEMANRVARLMGLMKERIGVWS